MTLERIQERLGCTLNHAQAVKDMIAEAEEGPPSRKELEDDMLLHSLLRNDLCVIAGKSVPLRNRAGNNQIRDWFYDAMEELKAYRNGGGGN